MPAPKILVMFYTSTGTNLAIAREAARAAEDAGAEVRLRRFAEIAPMEVVEGQEKWHATLKSMQEEGIEECQLDDLDWAEGYFVSVPTRYGLPPSQMTAFTDTTGGLWSSGALANKTFTATCSTSTMHGGQEGTLQALTKLATHWGCILVPPGYADPVKFEDGGNPYGYSLKQGDEMHAASIAYQARRLVEITGKLAA